MTVRAPGLWPGARPPERRPRLGIEAGSHGCRGERRGGGPAAGTSEDGAAQLLGEVSECGEPDGGDAAAVRPEPVARKRRATMPAMLFGTSTVTGAIASSRFASATTSRSAWSASGPYRTHVTEPATIPSSAVSLHASPVPTPLHPVRDDRPGTSRGRAGRTRAAVYRGRAVTESWRV